MDWVIIVGVLFAAFVEINIAGSLTGASFGPSVGANMISKTLAGVLRTGFVFVGDGVAFDHGKDMETGLSTPSDAIPPYE